MSPRYPEIVRASVGEITVGRKTYRRDVYIPVNGKTKKRGKSLCREHDGQPPIIHPKELQKVCRGGPEILFVGAGKEGKVESQPGGAAVFEPAGNPLRGLADRPGGGGLQRLEAAQGRADARELLRKGPGTRDQGQGNPRPVLRRPIAASLQTQSSATAIPESSRLA